MDKVRVHSPDLGARHLYEIDVVKSHYKEVAQVDDALAPGHGIEIYLPKENRKALVAIYSDGIGLKFFCVNQEFDLIGTQLHANMESLLRNKRFSLHDPGGLVLSVFYRYRDAENDLLEDLAHRLDDPIKNLYFQNMVKFFNETNSAERMRIDKDNVAKLTIARSSYRKKLSWFGRVMDFIRNY